MRLVDDDDDVDIERKKKTLNNELRCLCLLNRMNSQNWN